MVVNVFVCWFFLLRRIFCLSCSFTLFFLFVSLSRYVFLISSFFHRFNNVHVQSELLKKIPRLTDISVPTNYLDWKLKQMSVPRSMKDVSKAIGHRDRGFAADEPHYMLVRSEDENPRHMGILDQYRFDFFVVF